MSQFDVEYKLRTAIKGQALADFVPEFKPWPSADSTAEEEKEETQPWKLNVDDSSNKNGFRAGIILVSPDNFKITSTIRFKYKASKNEAKYEALLARLRLAHFMKVERITVYIDFQLVVNQMKEKYQAWGKKMSAYLNKVKEELKKFKHYDIFWVPRAGNNNANALARLATSKDSELLKIVAVEVLEYPMIQEDEGEKVMPIETIAGGMLPIYEFLSEGKLSEDKVEAKKLRNRSARFVI